MSPEQPLPFEPVGWRYDALLGFLLGKASQATVVIDTTSRPENRETFARVLKALEPAVLERRRADSWPGTELGPSNDLPGHELLVLRYEAELAEQLRRIARCLYSWQAPLLPEDLTFYRPDGSVLLGSIGHEFEAWISFDESELAELKSRFARAEARPPKLELQPGKVEMRGGAASLLGLARYFRNPTESLLPMFLEISIEPGADRLSVTTHDDRLVVTGDSIDLDIVAHELFSFVARAGAGYAASPSLLFSPALGHPALRSDALELEIILEAETSENEGFVAPASPSSQ